MKVKARDVETGQIQEKTFRANQTIQQAIVEKNPAQFLYREDSFYLFMNSEDYSQIRVDEKVVGDLKNFLMEGEEVQLLMYEGRALDIALPPQIEMKVVKAAPGLKGNTVSGATKTAETETGHKISVPLFIEMGDVVVVDTRTGEYKSRAGG